MTVSLEHQERIVAFQEEREREALAKARAIFDLVSCLALARKFVTDKPLQRQISLALLQCHLCFEGDVKPDLPKGIVPIVQRHGFESATDHGD